MNCYCWCWISFKKIAFQSMVLFLFYMNIISQDTYRTTLVNIINNNSRRSCWEMEQRIIARNNYTVFILLSKMIISCFLISHNCMRPLNMPPNHHGINDWQLPMVLQDIEWIRGYFHCWSFYSFHYLPKISIPLMLGKTVWSSSLHQLSLPLLLDEKHLLPFLYILLCISMQIITLR